MEIPATTWALTVCCLAMMAVQVKQNRTIAELKEELKKEQAVNEQCASLLTNIRGKVDLSEFKQLERKHKNVKNNYAQYRLQATSMIENLKKKIENCTLLEDVADEQAYQMTFWQKKSSKWQARGKTESKGDCNDMVKNTIFDHVKLRDDYHRDNWTNCQVKLENLRQTINNITSAIKPKQIYKDCTEKVTSEHYCRNAEYIVSVLHTYWTF